MQKYRYRYTYVCTATCTNVHLIINWKTNHEYGYCCKYEHDQEYKLRVHGRMMIRICEEEGVSE